MYAVAGVSGKTGAVAAQALLDQGHPVRVIVRDAAKGEAWRARGAEVAVADLGDEAAVTEALRGTAGAYLLVPPMWGAADPVAEGAAIGATLARAAKAAGVPHVVLLSSVGAQHPDGTGPIRILHHTERALRDGGVPTTYLRAAYFLENWGMVAQVVKTDGVLPSFLPAGRPVPQVATADIGRVAAELLVSGPRGQRVLELLGATDPTPEEIAAAFGRALGRPIHLATAPLAAAEPTFVGAGLPPQWAALYAEMYRGIDSGRVDGEGAETLRGRLGPDHVLPGLVA